MASRCSGGAGSEWHAAGPGIRLQWSNQISPGLISSDNRTVWSGFFQYVEGHNVFHLVSLDTAGGTWGDWFGAEDMKGAPPGSDDVILVTPVPD